MSTTKTPLTILARDVAFPPLTVTRADYATQAQRIAEVVRILAPYALTDRQHQDGLLVARACEEVGIGWYGFSGVAMCDALIADGHDLARTRAEMAKDRD